MEKDGQLHAPAALPPGKEPTVPYEWEAEWTSESVSTAWNEEIEPRLLGRPIHSPVDVPA
jgi:hypothetical protein